MSEQTEVCLCDVCRAKRENIVYWDQVNDPSKASPTVPTAFVLSQLNEKSLADIRQIVREEVEAVLTSRDNARLDKLLFDIYPGEPFSEQEEMAALLVTLSEDEWNGLMQLVNERRNTEA